MNEIDGVVRAQVDALMELLEESRSANCREAIERAELQAAEFRRRARKQARERVRQAAHEERERLEHALRMAQAELDTEQRRRARQRDLELIRAGRTALQQALSARWHVAAGRRDWARVTLLEAQDVLLGREWTLEHPAAWPAAERDAALQFAREQCGATIVAEPADELDTGLRVRSGGALVDMSIPGLMANDRAIEGELLAEFNRTAKARGETT